MILLKMGTLVNLARKNLYGNPFSMRVTTHKGRLMGTPAFPASSIEMHISLSVPLPISSPSAQNNPSKLQQGVFTEILMTVCTIISHGT